jgi:flagellar biosynthesis anti-sigma factor FlgM
MKIYGGEGSGKVDSYIKTKVSNKKKEAMTGSSQEAKATDSVEISQTSAEIRRAKEVIKEQPEIRTEKVRVVKKEVDEGTYKVDGEKVAEKIIRENVLDELL